MKLIKHEKVNSCMTDPLANLSVIGCFQIAEETVTELMGKLKIDGITVKKAYNAVWVFAKSKLKILSNIAWNEQYTVVGFISKVTRVSIDIDVEIKNESDEICAYLRMELCALDLQSGKIRRVSTVGVDDSIQAEAPETDLSFSKFDAEYLPEVAQVKIKYTNIDFAGHTNNKEYIRFILNTYSVRELEERPIKEMDIVYVNQTYENDILTVQKNSDKDRDIIAIQKDGNYIVKSEIVRSDSKTYSKDDFVS
ncbi:MAG: thioesterase [Eubacteriales bacterium]|nr:thioesterase [Eubacteriales bacterium]